MAKTLKQFKQGYTPKSADEKKFVDKHTVRKTPDANGNKDDVFNATNVKAYDRELEHGYNPGSDEEVYEQVKQETTKPKISRQVPVPDDGATADPGKDPKTGKRPIITHGPNKGKEWTQENPGPTNPNFRPFAVQKEGVGPALAAGAVLTGVGGLMAYRALKNTMEKAAAKRKEEEKETAPPKKIEEKKLTPAEMKKREEVAIAIERENPNMPMAKKMAIATATAKKVAEEKDVPFEGPYTKSGPHGPKSRAKHLAKMAMKNALNKAVEDAAKAGVKKKVSKTELKDHLLSLYTDQLSEEDNQILQEMLETEEGTKIAFMISMLIEDEQMIDEVLKKSEKYSHRSFLNKLKQNNTGA